MRAGRWGVEMLLTGYNVGLLPGNPGILPSTRVTSIGCPTFTCVLWAVNSVSFLQALQPLRYFPTPERHHVWRLKWYLLLKSKFEARVLYMLTTNFLSELHPNSKVNTLSTTRNSDYVGFSEHNKSCPQNSSVSWPLLREKVHPQKQKQTITTTTNPEALLEHHSPACLGALPTPPWKPHQSAVCHLLPPEEPPQKEGTVDYRLGLEITVQKSSMTVKPSNEAQVGDGQQLGSR